MHNTGGAAGFMAASGTVISYRIRTVELGYKPLSAFLCQFRPKAPEMACELVGSILR